MNADERGLTPRLIGVDRRLSAALNGFFPHPASLDLAEQIRPDFMAFWRERRKLGYQKRWLSRGQRSGIGTDPNTPFANFRLGINHGATG
jgi:hypothetical protein